MFFYAKIIEVSSLERLEHLAIGMRVIQLSDHGVTTHEHVD